MFKWRKHRYILAFIVLKSTETSNSKVIDKINAILSPSINLNVAYQTKKTKVFSPIKTKSERKSLQMLCTNISAVNVRAKKKHHSTRTEEQPTPSEVSLHQHVPHKQNFTLFLRTNYTTIGEALVYNTVPSQYRMNNIRPPYQLQLYDTEVKSTEGFALWFLTYLKCFCNAFAFNIL